MQDDDVCASYCVRQGEGTADAHLALYDAAHVAAHAADDGNVFIMDPDLTQAASTSQSHDAISSSWKSMKSITSPVCNTMPLQVNRALSNYKRSLEAASRAVRIDPKNRSAVLCSALASLHLDAENLTEDELKVQVQDIHLRLTDMGEDQPVRTTHVLMYLPCTHVSE